MARLVSRVLAGVPLALAASTVLAQAPAPGWDVTRPRGQTREIDFVATEGTWMSVDVSPDGRWILFDLLGHIYRVPASGGDAECLTQNSGVAVNFHPRYSPDGTVIAFVSDRRGQDNLWLMDPDGSHPRPVFLDPNLRVFEPAWTPDGQYVLVRRHHMGEGLFVESGLWLYHKDGGAGTALVGPEEVGRYVGWPSSSPDGGQVYFHGCTGETGDGCVDVVRGGHQIWRMERRTGEIIEITTGAGGAMAPEVSPNGRWLAFARRIPDAAITFKGHRFSPRTALWLRDLTTGAERVIMDPIEVDLAERQIGARAVFHAERVLPGYAWTRDSRSLVIAQGGKLRRLEVERGTVETIPFRARVHRTISEQVGRTLAISEGPFEAKFLRWHTVSPNGRRLAFQAVGKIWLMDLPGGTPRRLTAGGFEPLELSPAWSPDGEWIAFTTWDDENRGGGRLWKVSAGGGAPVPLTREAGEYLDPAWSPDGTEVVVTRGSGATARGAALADNPWYEIVRVPASGGTAQPVARVNPPRSYYLGGQIFYASFGPGGRIFFPDSRAVARQGQQHVKRAHLPGASDAAGLRFWRDRFGGVVTELVSVRPDGSDRRVHLVFPYATAVVPSPDGRWVAFQEGDNVYLTPFAGREGGGEPVQVDRRKADGPVRALSLEGGLFPRWRDSATVEFGSGARYFAHQVDARRTDTVAIRLVVPRDVPRGSVALAGARIVTLDHRKVVERGTVVVKGGRISCVGQCLTSGVGRVVDVTGKTIIPGFIDLHAHHHSANNGVVPRRDWESAVYLAYGVTTTRDPYVWEQNLFPLGELIEAGQVIGPRSFSTGLGLWSGDAPNQNAMETYADVLHEVHRLASWGAVAVKQYTLPRREQRQWIVEAARTSGLPVTAEGEDNVYNLGMMMDGQTGFEHNSGYLPLYRDVTTFLGRARTHYSATLIVGGPGFPWGDQYFRQIGDVWRDPKQRSWIPWRILLPENRQRMLRPVSDYPFPILAQEMADIIAQGGYGAIGSHGQQHGIGSHWDVWIMATAMSPMEALEVASLHGARHLGAEADLGSIAVGKVADLMVLNANPLENIRNTADIRYVMKAGRLFDANSLDQLWPVSRPYGGHPWLQPEALRRDDRGVDYWDKAH